MIGQFDKEPKVATRGFEQIVKTLIEKKIISFDDLKVLITNEDAAKLDSSHGFIVKRLQVFVNECIKQVDDVDHFDYLSQVLLAIYKVQVWSHEEDIHHVLQLVPPLSKLDLLEVMTFNVRWLNLFKKVISHCHLDM